ncbi:MAG: dipicolinate synthase subunit DpsA [Clostridia bacterium]|nr:dipicolinate synthase subunit DpsA [Clostridia bacterium]
MNSNITKNKISVIGGDLRQLYMIEELSKSNSEVYSFGLPKNNRDEINVFCCNSLEQSLSYADNIILPLPISSDDVSVLSPLSVETVLIDDIINLIKNTDKLLLVGKASENLINKFNENKIKTIDYFNDEQLNIQNAILTAEGAVELAIKKTDFSIYGSNCLVTGYGRISKILSKTLLSMGANVTVAARNNKDLNWAEINGYIALKIEEIENYADKFNIIFNTVPSRIINDNIILKLNKNCLIIELASYPYGVDFEACKNHQIQFIHAASLPGKVAPKSAGIIICKTAINIFKEENRWKT